MRLIREGIAAGYWSGGTMGGVRMEGCGLKESAGGLMHVLNSTCFVGLIDSIREYVQSSTTFPNRKFPVVYHVN